MPTSTTPLSGNREFLRAYIPKSETRFLGGYVRRSRVFFGSGRQRACSWMCARERNIQPFAGKRAKLRSFTAPRQLTNTYVKRPFRRMVFRESTPAFPFNGG